MTRRLDLGWTHARFEEVVLDRICRPALLLCCRESSKADRIESEAIVAAIEIALAPIK